MAMSAVARSDTLSPPLQAGVKCATVPAGAVKASRGEVYNYPFQIRILH